VVSTLDTQQVIDNILDEVQRLLSVHQCALLVMNEPTQHLEILASRGLSPNYPSRISFKESQNLPACRAIITGRPVQVADIEADPDAFPLASLARAEGYRSILVIPLTAPHISRAALSIYRTDKHYFSEQEIDLAANFANYAAIALEHATLFSLTDAELQKRVRFLSALNRVGHTVSQSLVVDHVLNNALEAVFEVMPVDACWIYLQRETENFLRLRAQFGFPEELAASVPGQQVTYGQGVTGQVVQTGRVLLLNQVELESGEWSDEPVIAGGEWRSLAAAPLLAKESIIGVLGMASRTDQAFTVDEVDLLQAIGNQIAIAVVNARLYRRSREVATLEERNRVAREIHDTLAQGFTGILIQLQAAERLSLKSPEQALQSLQEARELARQSLQEARRSVLNLRPTVLENHTLDQIMAREVQRLAQTSGLKADFILEGYPSPLSPEIEQNLYRISQEALTNISRHARASRVVVCLVFESKTVTLTITDDGIGLNREGDQLPPGAALNSGSNGGFGLVSIKERVSLMKGQLRLTSPPAGGMQIKVVIPR
jgi:signal transduction histidine kinase